MNDTEKLIHELFVLWDQDNDAMKLTDEEVFAAGAKYLIAHLVKNNILK